MGLDDFLALDDFLEALQGWGRGALHILTHGTHLTLFSLALGSTLLVDGSIVLLKVLAVDLIKAFSSKIEGKTSAQWWGMVQGE